MLRSIPVVSGALPGFPGQQPDGDDLGLCPGAGAGADSGGDQAHPAPVPPSRLCSASAGELCCDSGDGHVRGASGPRPPTTAGHTNRHDTGQHQAPPLSPSSSVPAVRAERRHLAGRLLTQKELCVHVPRLQEDLLQELPPEGSPAHTYRYHPHVEVFTYIWGSHPRDRDQV